MARGVDGAGCCIPVDCTTLTMAPEQDKGSISVPSQVLRWRALVDRGDLIDACDPNQKWYAAFILRRERGKLLISYIGWSARWDEWLDLYSDRIMPFGTHVYDDRSDNEKNGLGHGSDNTPVDPMEAMAHDNAMIHSIRNLYRLNYRTDMWLSCGNDSIPVHRSILAASWNHFETAVVCTDREACIYTLNFGVSSLVLHNLIELVYTGCILFVKENETYNLLCSSAVVGAPAMEHALIEHVHAKNVVATLEALHLAEKRRKTQFPELNAACLRIFCESYDGSLGNEVEGHVARLPSTTLVQLLQHVAKGSEKKNRERKRKRSAYDFMPKEKCKAQREGPFGNDPFFRKHSLVAFLIRNLEKMYTSRSTSTCDLLIRMNDVTFFAHRFVLATQSAFFKGLAASLMNDSTDVEVSHLFRYSESFEHILHYMYTGRVNRVNFDVALDILQSIDFFGLVSDTLKRACESMLIAQTRSGNLGQALHFSFYKLRNPALMTSIVQSQRKGDLIAFLKETCDVPLLKAISVISVEGNGDDQGFERDSSSLYVVSEDLHKMFPAWVFSSCKSVYEAVERQLVLKDPHKSNSLCQFPQNLQAAFGVDTCINRRLGGVINVIKPHILRIPLQRY